jgi:hypothetical protein
MQNNFFNVGNKTNTGADLYTEGVHYKVYKDGNGTELKIANLENEELCPRQGVIILSPMKESNRHRTKVTVEIVRDRKMGVIWGIPTGVDLKTKELKFLRIMLDDHETFDLSDPNQAMRWAIVKNSLFVEGSPNLRGKPLYKVKDEEKEAQRFLAGRQQKRKAVDLAEALYGQELHDIARNLGIPPEANSDTTLMAEVIKRAENDPKAFMVIYDSPTRKEMTVLKRALAEGIVTTDTLHGFMYNGQPLGANEVIAVEYLKEWPQVCQTIDLMTQKSSIEPVKHTNAPKIPLDDKDARIARLEAEAAARESLIKEMSAKNIVADGEERTVWLTEAKRLNIKGCHMIKLLDSLKDKVLEFNPEFEG